MLWCRGSRLAPALARPLGLVGQASLRPLYPDCQRQKAVGVDLLHNLSALGDELALGAMNLQHNLVVNLQHDARAGFLPEEHVVDACHGHLDDIRSTTLANKIWSLVGEARILAVPT